MGPSRKKQIIEEATSLFSRFGYDKVTTKQLASACDITEPALYRHFPSKESIYDAVLDSLHDTMNYKELFEKLEESRDLSHVMKSISGHLLCFFNKHRELYRLLLYSTLREHRKAREVFRAIRSPYIDFLNKKLDELYGLKLIKNKNNLITARCFIGMVFDCAMNATMWKGFQGRTFSPDTIIENNVSIFIDGLIKK